MWARSVSLVTVRSALEAGRATISRDGRVGTSKSCPTLCEPEGETGFQPYIGPFRRATWTSRPTGQEDNLARTVLGDMNARSVRRCIAVGVEAASGFVNPGLDVFPVRPHGFADRQDGSFVRREFVALEGIGGREPFVVDMYC